LPETPPSRGATSTIVEISRARPSRCPQAALLASVSPWEREIVQEVMAAYPALTLAKTVEMLQEAGM